MHASGRNAAMVRQVVPHESIAALARGGAAFLRRLPSDWPLETHFEQNGSFLLASARDSAKLKQDGARSRERGVPAEWWPIERIVEAVPILAGSPAEGGLWCPTDGVVDIHSLLHGYLKAAASAGARLRTSSPLRRVVVRQGKVCARPDRIRRNNSGCCDQRGWSLGPTDRSFGRGLTRPAGSLSPPSVRDQSSGMGRAPMAHCLGPQPGPLLSPRIGRPSPLPLRRRSSRPRRGCRRSGGPANAG